MGKRILRGLLVVAKYYCLCVGLLVTIMVAHKLVKEHYLNPIPTVKAQLNIKLPPAIFNNQPNPGAKK